MKLDAFLSLSQERLTSWLRTSPAMQGLPFWIAAIFVGFVATAYAQAYHYIEALLQQILLIHPHILWVLSPLCFTLGWWLVHTLSPGAGGSGIPQVLAVYSLSEPQKYKKSIRRILGIRVWVTKIISSLLCALGGGGLANEGPTIQIASGIFFSVGKRFQSIWPQIKPDFFLVTGAGAGVAAAFNTPLGGIVYAIEEFASAQLHRFKTALIAAVIVAGLIAQWLVGSYLYLGFPIIEAITPRSYAWVIVLAALGGIWGALFGRVCYSTTAWRLKNITRPLQKLSLAIITGFIIAGLYYFIDSRSIGSGKNVVVDLLFNSYQAEASSSLVLTRFLSPLVSYLSGCAGGVFAPALAAGGSLGAWFAEALNSPNQNLLILIGMISFLTGMTRLPFTSFVLVLEMTDRHSAIFPMMIAALVAQATARLIDKQTLYEKLKPLYSAKLVPDQETPS
jgi:H+/Cl- antiporter ClcA